MLTKQALFMRLFFAANNKSNRKLISGAIKMKN